MDIILNLDNKTNLSHEIENFKVETNAKNDLSLIDNKFCVAKKRMDLPMKSISCSKHSRGYIDKNGNTLSFKRGTINLRDSRRVRARSSRPMNFSVIKFNEKQNTRNEILNQKIKSFDDKFNGDENFAKNFFKKSFSRKFENIIKQNRRKKVSSDFHSFNQTISSSMNERNSEFDSASSVFGKSLVHSLRHKTKLPIENNNNGKTLPLQVTNKDTWYIPLRKDERISEQFYSHNVVCFCFECSPNRHENNV